MPARKKSLSSNLQVQSLSYLNTIPDDQVYKFEKNEIVWAKMKFYSAWPAKVRHLNQSWVHTKDLCLDYLMICAQWGF